MRYAGFLVTLVAGVMVATVGAAQVVRQAGPPQPAPPSGFQGSQYVDSRGCIYIRAGISGQTNWVPRVAADRTPICGSPPSSVRPPVVADAPASRPAEQTTPAPRQAAMAPRVLDPAENAGSAQARALTPPATALPAQRIIEVPPAEARGRSVTAEVNRPAEPARRMTLSQVCAGRSGILQGFVVASTGAPVNCGGAARVVRAPATAEPDRPTPARVTRGEICARIARTGEIFIDQGTGRTVACPDTGPATPTLARAPAPQRTVSTSPPGLTAHRTVQAPASTVAGAASCPGISAEAEAFLRQIGAPLDCGPWTRGSARADVPVSNVEASVGQTATVSTRGTLAPVPSSSVSAALPPAPIFRQPVPASNPSAFSSVRAIASPPAGYRSVWDDGRVNMSRGLARPYF